MSLYVVHETGNVFPAFFASLVADHSLITFQSTISSQVKSCSHLYFHSIYSRTSPSGFSLTFTPFGSVISFQLVESILKLSFSSSGVFSIVSLASFFSSLGHIFLFKASRSFFLSCSSRASTTLSACFSVLISTSKDHLISGTMFVIVSN